MYIVVTFRINRTFLKVPFQMNTVNLHMPRNEPYQWLFYTHYEITEYIHTGEIHASQVNIQTGNATTYDLKYILC